MKKKIIAVCLVVCLLAIAVVGGTLAYMTDTDERTNTFTAGKVGLSLDEAKVKLDEDPDSASFGDLIADGTDRVVAGDADPNYHLFPAMTVTKDPTITIDEYSENAWVGAKVTVTGDLHDLLGSYSLYAVDGDADGINFRQVVVDNPDYDAVSNPDVPQKLTCGLATGDLFSESVQFVADTWHGLSLVEEGTTYVMYQEADLANETWVFYIFFKEPMAEKESVVLFDTLHILPQWDNAEMAKLNGMNIKVEAFATQTNGFANVYEALTTAFPTHFDFS